MRAWRVFQGGNLFFSTGITLGGSAPESARFQTETWFQYWNLKTSRRGTLRRSTAFLRVVGTYHSTHWPSLRRINVETVADDTPVAHPRWEPYAGKPHVGFWAVVNDSGLGRNRNSACVRHHRSGNPLAPTVLLAGRRNADDGRQISLLASAACGRSAALFSKVCLRRCFVFMRCHLVGIDAQ